MKKRFKILSAIGIAALIAVLLVTLLPVGVSISSQGFISVSSNVAYASPALPTFKAAGVFTQGNSTITPPYPVAPNAPVANDIAILVCESENEPISLTTAQGFVELGAQANKAAGTAVIDPASRLAVYWKRCVGGDTAPVVADSGNHTTGRIYLFSGVKTSGNPWNVYAEGNDGGANDLSGVIPGATTTVADCLIFIICTSSYNATSTTEFAGWANTDLANILERGNNVNSQGLGGGHGSATGEKANAGAYGATTVTLAHTSYKGAMSIALEAVAPSITNSPPGNDFQILSVNTTSATAINYFTITNTGNCAVNVTAQGIDLTGGDDTWTLSDTATPNTNIYGLMAGLDDADDLFDIIVKKSTTNTLVTNLGIGLTQSWGLKIYMPTSVVGCDYVPMSATITLVASAY